MQRFRQSIVFSFVLVLASNSALAQQPAEGKADDRTRTFAAAKCRYTLPGPEWKWSQPGKPSQLFTATCPKGLVVYLSVVSVPTSRLDSGLVQNLEQGFYGSGQATKRGGRFVTIQGSSWYQIEATLADGRTVACRTFVSKGLSYTLGIVGGRQPVEQDPEFETIHGGFSIIEPPPDANPAGDKTSALAGGVIVMVFVVALVGRTLGKSKVQAPKSRIRRKTDDESPDLVAIGATVLADHGGSQTGLLDEPPPLKLLLQPTKDTRECQQCGYPRAAHDTRTCPNCGNRGFAGPVPRFANRGAVLGMIAGPIAGAIWEAHVMPNDIDVAIIVGALMGFLGGVFIGLAGGLIVGLVAKVAGVR
ncbi:MAG: hypothetical protein ACJ8F7_01345 [Gemmataceae bacterium]